MQQSSTATYSAAISYLQNAESRLVGIAGNVQGVRGSLLQTYGGVDGQAYAQVIQTWLDEVERIRHTCEAMQHQLEASMSSDNKAQGHNLDAVSRQKTLTPFNSPVATSTYGAMTT
jgi:uncharacterized protein YukE